jgi:tyrosyl-tRNA synthetase
MSKSDPDSAIFMEDSAEDVKRKIKKAYCPPAVAEENPILDYAKNVIIAYYGTLTVQVGAGEEKAPVAFTRYEDLEAEYVADRVHPGDLKAAVTEAMNRILEPVRLHFSSGEPKALLAEIKKFVVTR